MEKKKESRSGMEIMNLLQVVFELVHRNIIFSIFILCIKLIIMPRPFMIFTERRQTARNMEWEEG